MSISVFDSTTKEMHYCSCSGRETDNMEKIVIKY